MILAVVLGLLIGLALGALGGGGSILAVPVLVYVVGQTASEATATSLVAVGAAAAVGVIGHARRHRVRWGAAAVFVAVAVPGAWLGALANQRIDGEVLLLLFSALILVAAHRMLTACPSCTRVGEETAVAGTGAPPSTPVDLTPARTGSAQLRLATRDRLQRLVATGSGRSVAHLVAAGTAVGFLTGLFGVGGGFVVVPALTLALGLSMPVAIGTSLAVIVGNAAVTLGFRGVDAVDWSVAVPFAATMLVGSVAGSLVAHRLDPQRSLHAFAGLLVLVATANGLAAAYALAS